MWVMRQTDVFVTFHGAGQMNAIFLPEHASMIEVRTMHVHHRPTTRTLSLTSTLILTIVLTLIQVRGLNASLNLADHWHPQISSRSGFRYFW